MPLKNGRTIVALQQILVGSVIPPGTVQAFGGEEVPDGWLLCNGLAVSRTTYSSLFNVLSTSHGQGDGSTTFNLPDYRGIFLRGRVDVTSFSGSGTVSSNNATFTNHGINRTGFKVRLAVGVLSGLAILTDYYAIVIDSNTLAFATSFDNAIAGTKIAISGPYSATFIQYEDPDVNSRTVMTVGGNSGSGVGSQQIDTLQNITGNSGVGKVERAVFATGAFFSASGSGTDIANSGSLVSSGFTQRFDASRVARTSTETRPKNSLVNYIIKY